MKPTQLGVVATALVVDSVPVGQATATRVPPCSAPMSRTAEHVVVNAPTKLHASPAVASAPKISAKTVAWI